ncbi:unnamed protein product [Urochloa decumbens]|uniref:Uncharacterized protein n=1 Tax=Urochloa decumbens TaxID=240449 RepID=A0ABC9BUF1_9POAL
MAVSASSGAMNSLIGKLTALMGEEYAKLKGVRKEVPALEDEFRSINALLDKLASMDELDGPAKEWRNQVKDMSVLKKLRARHQIASKIQEIKAQVKEIDNRRKRCNVDDCVHKPTNVPVDPRVLVILEDAKNLVGIDGPTGKLIQLVTGGEQELKVASIVGFGGLGKTTLANHVYCKLEGQFHCRAFVSVSQKPDMAKLLGKILSQIGCNLQTCDLDDILYKIKEYLQDKRYFIVIDDIWDSSAWKYIRLAFPDNNCGSIILTTTRDHYVALTCCSDEKYVYKMQPLSEEDSRMLFFRRVSRSRQDCTDEFGELSAEIPKKYGGLPLAIISIASLLAGQPKKEWESVHKSLGSMFQGNPRLEDMKRILDLSYKTLPPPLKTCLLYFGMYAEDHIILKEDLVMQWIAEGFVSKSPRLEAEDVAGNYFNELVNMSMIQPVKIDRVNDEVVTCKVHDIMLDLIREKSAEENFNDVVDDPQASAGLHKRIRRVSIHYGGEGVQPTISGSLSQVRSVMVFTSVLVPSFQGFKYVRVLFLDFSIPVEQLSPYREVKKEKGMTEMDCTGTSGWTQKLDLTVMCGLFLLSYLKIIWDADLDLPRQLFGLQYLKTIVVISSYVSRTIASIPLHVAPSHRLRHLVSSYYNLTIKGNICNFKSMRTLKGFDIYNSSLESIDGLGELTSLRHLQITAMPCKDHFSPLAFNALHSSLERLACSSCLHTFEFYSFLLPIDMDWSILSRFSPHLRRLILRTRIPRIPEWISQLHNLCYLLLMVREVAPEDDGICILAGLPSLVHLSLEFQEHPGVIRIRGPAGLTFQALKYLDLSRCISKLLLPVFETGVMPKLQELQVRSKSANDLDKWLEWASGGIGHLPASVKRVEVQGYWCGGDSMRGKYATKSEMTSVFKRHHPAVNLINSIF